MVLWHIHTAGKRDGDRDGWAIINYVEMFTLIRDRDRNQEPFSPVVPVELAVLFLCTSPGPVQCELAISDLRQFQCHYSQTTRKVAILLFLSLNKLLQKLHLDNRYFNEKK